MLAEGASFSAIKQRLGNRAPTIIRWKHRFLPAGLDGLDTNHPGQPASVLTPKLRAKILSATRKQPKDGSTHWSCRKLAAALGVSKDAVHRVWKEAGLKPHRLEWYMSSDDPDFETKAADIIGLYLNPPQHAAVICVDEKTAIQALDRLDPVLAALPGRVQRQGFEYYRNGTLSVCGAEYRHRSCSRKDCRTPHQSGLHYLFEGSRCALPTPSTDAHHPRQSLRSQDRARAAVYGAKPPCMLSLHTHLLLMAQPLDPEVADSVLEWKQKSKGTGLIFPSPVTGYGYHASPIQQDWIRRAGWCLVACSECGAVPGVACTVEHRGRGKKFSIPEHDSRRELATEKGFGGVGWHTFRHTYRTFLGELEAPLEVQKVLMRQADISTTLKYRQSSMENPRTANRMVVREILVRRS